jgi:hypothetical protein
MAWGERKPVSIKMDCGLHQFDFARGRREPGRLSLGNFNVNEMIFHLDGAKAVLEALW